MHRSCRDDPGLKARVTRDHLGRHEFAQPRKGYRFSIDSVLLAGFSLTVLKNASPVTLQKPLPTVDLCAGSGVVSVLLAAAGVMGPFTAVELDQTAAYCCRENYKAAGIDGRVIEQNLLTPHENLKPGSFSLAVSNPPFTRRGHGRVPPDPGRARARHGLELDADDLWPRVAGLLPKGGRFIFCWQPLRLDEAMAGLTASSLTPKRLRLAHGRIDRDASLALIEAVKGGRPSLTVDPPLIVYGKGQNHTKEVEAIYERLCGP